MKINENFNSNNNQSFDNNINTEELDIYNQCSFQALQQERFEKDADYHICVVQENETSYLLDASMFIENYITKSSMKNPLTRNPITNFFILVSSKEDVDFKWFMSKEEVMTHPNHLPILWNDTSRSLNFRMDCLLEYGSFFKKQAPQKTIQAYEKAANMGSAEAMLRFVELYRFMGKTELSMAYLKEVLNHHDELEVKNLFYCAHRAEDYRDRETAFKAYLFAAQKKSMIAIGEIILQLEEKKDVNSEEIAFWRKQLPLKWQESPISEFFNHLSEIKYTYSHKGYP